MTNADNEEIKRYLLGDVSPEVQRAVEERLLIEESFIDELGSIEEELIDDYVGGDLTAAERAGFEQHFLSTDERRRKLRFAQALARYTSAKAGATAAEPEPQPSPARPTLAERLRAFWRAQPVMLRAAAAVSVAAILAAAWWLSFPRTPSTKTFATLSLNVTASNRAEGAQSGKVTLPLKADALKISLALPEGWAGAASYRVELLDENEGVKPLEVAGRDEKSVSVLIPAGQLKRGQYALRLYATRGAGADERVPGSYFFSAE